MAVMSKAVVSVESTDIYLSSLVHFCKLGNVEHLILNMYTKAQF